MSCRVNSYSEGIKKIIHVLMKGRQHCGVHIECSSDSCRCSKINSMQYPACPSVCGCHGCPSSRCGCHSSREGGHVVFCKENMNEVLHKYPKLRKVVGVNSFEIFVYDADRCGVDWRCEIRGEQKKKRTDVIVLIPSVEAEKPNIILIEVKRHKSKGEKDPSQKKGKKTENQVIRDKTRNAEIQLECTKETIERMWLEGGGKGSLEKNMLGVIVLGVKPEKFDSSLLDREKYKKDQEFKIVLTAYNTIEFEEYDKKGCPCSIGAKDKGENFWKFVLDNLYVHKKRVV